MRDLDGTVRLVAGQRYKGCDDLLSRWRGVVEGVESGYRFSIYDYANDLDVRSLIQDVLDHSTDPVIAIPELTDLDQRFMTATRPSNSTLATRDRGAWAQRVPQHPGPELQADLEARATGP
jgi:hypothetical protein